MAMHLPTSFQPILALLDAAMVQGAFDLSKQL